MNTEPGVIDLVRVRKAQKALDELVKKHPELTTHTTVSKSFSDNPELIQSMLTIVTQKVNKQNQDVNKS